MLVKGVSGYKEYVCVDELYKCIVQQKLLNFKYAISLIAEQKGIDVMEKHTRKHQQKSYSTIGLVCRHRKLLKWKRCNKHIFVYIFLAPMFCILDSAYPVTRGLLYTQIRYSTTHPQSHLHVYYTVLHLTRAIRKCSISGRILPGTTIQHSMCTRISGNSFPNRGTKWLTHLLKGLANPKLTDSES